VKRGQYHAYAFNGRRRGHRCSSHNGSGCFLRNRYRQPFSRNAAISKEALNAARHGEAGETLLRPIGPGRDKPAGHGSSHHAPVFERIDGSSRQAGGAQAGEPDPLVDPQGLLALLAGLRSDAKQRLEIERKAGR
jgi:hypothetical protein